MNATCIDENAKFKKMPIQSERKAILREQGDKIIQFFSPCIGEKCIAYHVGICLRAYEALNKLQEGQK